MNQMTGTQIPEEDRLRADLYNFMGLILSAPPDRMLLDQCAGLNGDDTELGQGIATLAKLARLTKPATVEAEFNRLFIGLGRGELLPYASYYLTGFLNEKPLALLRQDMAARGLARADTVFEPEDNIASLMEMMGAMIAGRFGTLLPRWTSKRRFSANTSPLGRDISFPIWRGPKRRSSTRPWARSAAPSWRSNPRPSG